MKKILLIIFAIIPAVAVQAQQTADQIAVLGIEQQRIAAISARDASFLSNLYDGEYWGVSASGAVVHKAEQLDIYKTQDTHVVFGYEEIRATAYGNSAVVTGKRVIKSKAGSTLGQTRYLVVYSRLTDQWKVVLGQETDVIRK